MEMYFIAVKIFSHFPQQNLLILVKLNFNIPLLNQTYFYAENGGILNMIFSLVVFFFEYLFEDFFPVSVSIVIQVFALNEISSFAFI